MQKRRGYNKYSRNVYYNKNKNFIKKRLTKLLIAIVILVFLVVIKKINNKYTNNIIQIIHKGINYEFSIKKSGKKLKGYAKKVLDVPEKIVSVLTNGESFNKYPPPIQGDIYKPFGEIKESKQDNIFSNGVDIIPKKDEKEICTIKDGTVKKIENKKTLGYFVTIYHEDMETVYGHLDNVDIKEGERITQGEKIGEIGSNKKGNKYLHFEIWEKGKPIDPQKVVNFDVKYN